MGTSVETIKNCQDVYNRLFRLLGHLQDETAKIISLLKQHSEAFRSNTRILSVFPSQFKLISHVDNEILVEAQVADEDSYDLTIDGKYLVSTTKDKVLSVSKDMTSCTKATIEEANVIACILAEERTVCEVALTRLNNYIVYMKEEAKNVHI